MVCIFAALQTAVGLLSALKGNLEFAKMQYSKPIISKTSPHRQVDAPLPAMKLTRIEPDQQVPNAAPHHYTVWAKIQTFAVISTNTNSKVR